MTDDAPPREFDEVSVTGMTGGGYSVTALHSMVATVSKDGWLKVWPMDDHDPRLPANHGGKIWMAPGAIVEILKRDE